MPTPRPTSIDDYFSQQDPVKAETLRAILHLILAQSPELEAKIAWNLPMVHRQGKYVAGLAAYKKHLTLAPWSAQIISDFKAQGRLEGYVVFKNCFQIPIDWKIDKALVKALVKARLAELDAE